jgi:hypothetical protein
MSERIVPRVRALAALAALAGVLAVVLGAVDGGSHAQADGPVYKVASRTARFRILNASGEQLSLVSSNNKWGSWREAPGSIPPLRTGDYTLHGSGEIQGLIDYAIGQTGYTAEISGLNPVVGANEMKCEVKKAGVPSPDVPYTCRKEEDRAGYNDVNFYFVIQPRNAATHTVTGNAIERAAAMEAACGAGGSGMRFENCGVREVENVSYGLAPPSPVGHLVANCGQEGTGGGTFYEASKTTGTSLSLGVSAEFKYGEGVQLVGKAYTKHTWADSQTSKVRYKLLIPSGDFGWMESAPPVTNIRADYKIQLGNQTYAIPAVTVSTPTIGELDKPLVIARVQKIVNPEQACKGRNEPISLPPTVSPALGAILRIGLSGHNQRVISAGDGSSSAALKLVEVKSGDLAQAWEFDELPGHPGDFLLRNAANPQVCLDQDVDFGHPILYSCKKGNENDVANQLWSMEFDPATNSYRLVSAINGRSIVSAAKESGSTLSMAAHPAAELGRWEFAAIGRAG